MDGENTAGGHRPRGHAASQAAVRFTQGTKHVNTDAGRDDPRKPSMRWPCSFSGTQPIRGVPAAVACLAVLSGVAGEGLRGTVFVVLGQHSVAWAGR